MFIKSNKEMEKRKFKFHTENNQFYIGDGKDENKK